MCINSTRRHLYHRNFILKCHQKKATALTQTQTEVWEFGNKHLKWVWWEQRSCLVEKHLVFTVKMGWDFNALGHFFVPSYLGSQNQGLDLYLSPLTWIVVKTWRNRFITKDAIWRMSWRTLGTVGNLVCEEQISYFIWGEFFFKIMLMFSPAWSAFSLKWTSVYLNLFSL